MKYTIMGFNQPKIVELNKSITQKITIEDLAIIKWIVDFSPSMSKHIDGDDVYYWLEYRHFLEDMPLIDIKKDSLYRRLMKLVEIGILTHKTIYKNGTYSYYGFGEKYKLLISDTSEKNPEGYGKKSVGGTEKNPDQNNPYTSNPSTNNKYNILLVSEVVKYLNSVVGKNFRCSKGSSTETLIFARTKEGYCLEDFKKVIDVKSSQWLKNKDMEKYLRPETLFSKSKFDGYLNEYPTASKTRDQLFSAPKTRDDFWNEEQYRDYCIKNNIEYNIEYKKI